MAQIDVKTPLERLSDGVVFECCLGELNAPPFLCLIMPFLALGVTLGVTIRGYILCVVVFVVRGYIFIYFGVTLGVTFAVFFGGATR